MDSEALRKEKLKEKRIAKVMAVTGWDEKTAYSAYRKAYKKHGIKFADYMAYKFYNIPEEEHGEQWKKIQEKDAKRKERVAEIMRETGWDEETAYTSYRKAYKEHGIRYTDYMSGSFTTFRNSSTK